MSIPRPLTTDEMSALMAPISMGYWLTNPEFGCQAHARLTYLEQRVTEAERLLKHDANCFDVLGQVEIGDEIRAFLAAVDR